MGVADSYRLDAFEGTESKRLKNCWSYEKHRVTDNL